MRKFFSKTLGYATCLCFLIVGGVFFFRYFDNDYLSVTTSADAFVSPDPRVSMLQIQNGNTILKLNKTPAPWPEEAFVIYRQAKTGKQVHIILQNSGDRVGVVFDIFGMTDDGYYKVVCSSEIEARKIADALGLTIR